MMKLFSYTSFIILVILLESCTGSNRSMLWLADSVIEEHPDSALMILQQIECNHLSKRDLPYYALLMTQANSKKHNREKDNNFVIIAWSEYGNDWFGDKGIRANFCMGEEAFDKDKPYDAMTYYLSAYEEAKRLGNGLWRARAAERIADLFYDTYNMEESGRYRKEAIEYFEKSNKPFDKLRAEAKLSAMYLDDGKITQTLKSIANNLNESNKQQRLDSILIEYSDGHSMGALMALARMYEFNEFFTSMLENALTDKDKIEGAVFSSNVNRIQNKLDDADTILLHAEKYVKTNEDKIKILYSRYLNARDEKKQELSLQLADSLLFYQEAIIGDIMKETVNGSHSNFYSRLSARRESQFLMLLTIAFAIIAILVIFVFLIRRIFKLKYKAQRAELEANIESLALMKAYADKISAEKNNLYKEITDRTIRQNNVLAQLFKGKWSTLNMLCEEYYEKGSSKKIHDLVIKKIENEVKKIGSEDGLLQIEEEVNKYMDNIVDKLRRECTFLKEKDISFATLIFAGFSVKAICFITDINSNNFYVRKNRLIKKIQNSDVQDKNEFITGLT